MQPDFCSQVCLVKEFSVRWPQENQDELILSTVFVFFCVEVWAAAGGGQTVVH